MATSGASGEIMSTIPSVTVEVRVMAAFKRGEACQILSIHQKEIHTHSYIQETQSCRPWVQRVVLPWVDGIISFGNSQSHSLQCSSSGHFVLEIANQLLFLCFLESVLGHNRKCELSSAKAKGRHHLCSFSIFLGHGSRRPHFTRGRRSLEFFYRLVNSFSLKDISKEARA